MTTLLERLGNAYRKHGPAKLLRLVFYNVWYHLRTSLHAWREGEDEIDEFDRIHGTETSRIREIGTLQIGSDNARHAVRYEPTDADVFPRLLEGIDADLSSFSFVDFGCGKGRILLLASNYPFREVIGVEFSPELAGVAERNVGIYRNAEQCCKAIRVVTGDAAEFALPDGPLVCYFYNPFGEEVMRRVVANMEESLRRDPRDMYLIYLNPRHRSVIDVSERWIPLEVAASHVIYRAAMASGGETA